jgi:hypothetical protein
MSATEGTAGGTCRSVRGLSDFEFLRQESAAVRCLPFSPLFFRVNASILTVPNRQTQLHTPQAERSLTYANSSVFHIIKNYPFFARGKVASPVDITVYSSYNLKNNNIQTEKLQKYYEWGFESKPKTLL